MNTAQIAHALEQDPLTSKRLVISCLLRLADICEDLLQTLIQAANLERIGLPFTFYRKRKENSLTVTDMPRSTIGNRSETF